MLHIQITATVWGNHKKEDILNKLNSQRKSADHIIVICCFENKPMENSKNIFQLSISAYPKDTKSISDSDLGEIIRLIHAEDSAFVSVTSIQIQ